MHGLALQLECEKALDGTDSIREDVSWDNFREQPAQWFTSRCGHALVLMTLNLKQGAACLLLLLEVWACLRTQDLELEAKNSLLTSSSEGCACLHVSLVHILNAKVTREKEEAARLANLPALFTESETKEAFQPQGRLGVMPCINRCFYTRIKEIH